MTSIELHITEIPVSTRLYSLDIVSGHKTFVILPAKSCDKSGKGKVIGSEHLNAIDHDDDITIIALDLGQRPYVHSECYESLT